MHIEERKVTVREVTEGYFNDAEIQAAARAVFETRDDPASA